VRKLLHRARRINTSLEWDAYKLKVKEYKYLLKKTKRDSWKDFTSMSDKMTLQSKLNKIIFKESKATLGALKTDGGYTTSITESLQVLLNAHFPESEPVGEAEVEGHNNNNVTPNQSTSDIVKKVDLSASCSLDRWINYMLVQRAIAGFHSNKTPGPDEMAPLLLKNLPELGIHYLTILFKASIKLGHVPQSWAKAKVIFIPKAGKTDYSDPRSFRPITLSSFILKTLERLILWRLNETTLLLDPLDENQFGFRQGISTEHAISKIVTELEKAKRAKRPTIALFLDIKGAFDNVSFSSLKKALELKKTDPRILNWFMTLLQNRTTYAQNDSKPKERSYIKHTRGVPQGGIHSPLMWNIAFDSFLQKWPLLMK
jgi:hypothetical protein